MNRMNRKSSTQEGMMPGKNVFLGELTRKELEESISNDTVKGAIVP